MGFGRSQAMLGHQEDRFYEAEIYRLRVVLLLRQSIARESEVAAWLLRALDVARRQQAKSPELRAATSLAHLWHAQGKDSEARDLLSPVYGWFTVGFDTVDLKAANSLLAQLSAKPLCAVAGAVPATAEAETQEISQDPARMRFAVGG